MNSIEQRLERLRLRREREQVKLSEAAGRRVLVAQVKWDHEANLRLRARQEIWDHRRLRLERSGWWGDVEVKLGLRPTSSNGF